MQPSWPRKWLAASGLVLSLALSQARPWLPWDRYFFDRNLALRHQVLPGQYPLMAHLSLKESDLSQWKSTRQEYDGLARLIRDCRDQGAAVIVLDLLITRGSNDDFKNLWPEVYGRSDVVLARSLTEVPRLPGASESGVATLQRDWDGLVRGYQLYYPEKNAPSLAWLAYLRLLRLPEGSFQLRDGSLTNGKETFPNQLYFQPRAAWSEHGSNIQFASTADLHRWQEDGESMLEGKAVFIGYVSPGVGDLASTVLDPAHPKVGIHATVLSNLMQRRFYQVPPLWIALAGGWAALLFGAASARLRGWMALVLLIPGLLVASQQALWGAYLLPWISWVAAAVLGFGLRKLWQQRLWRLNLDRLQRATDFQNPLIMKRMGSYLLVEKLGEGGYGAVYRGISAQTLDEGSSVAVKLFRFDKASGDEDRQRFLREARICLGLDHPGIVHVLESGEDHGFLYYTMEWVRGSNLRQWLADPHSQQQKIQVLTEMVEAMAYAHSHQVLHRDLKPENVVMQNGKPIIVDFGLALDSSSSRLTESHAVVGTLNYLSPERLGGVGNDARSDQYALGVMGYELFAGVSPFPIASAGEAIMYRLTEKPEPLVQLVGRDTFWARVVDRMMAQDPSQRFPDLAEAAALLRKGG